ncbi:MAG: hypothetical protein DWI23_05495 [Planctomycetota bacterium]|nr:MAG: hypothetical protein DWI23_05495 [Planctomycetota bacterium]
MRLILSLLFSPFCIAHSAISAQPNILWFVVDDMSAHFSCYGEKLIQTPAVDKIAPPEAHESLVSRENVAEVPLTGLSLTQLVPMPGAAATPRSHWTGLLKEKQFIFMVHLNFGIVLGAAQERVMRSTPTFSSTLACLACGLVFASAVGCGRRSAPSVQLVQGKVSLDGLPIAGATVGFSPDAGSGGLAAYGVTAADGVFTLTSVRNGEIGKGAVVGDYAVSVRKMKTVTEADIGTQISRQDFERQVRENHDIEGFKPEVAVVPKAYGEATRSGLRATVTPGPNVGPEFHFELRSDFKTK